MRILQVAYKSIISGGERVLFDLATSLKERGHEVLSVCPDFGQLPDALREFGIPVEIIPFRKTYDLLAARRLALFIRREGVEVLHSHSMLTNILSRIAGRWARVPVSVSTEHLTMDLARGGRGKGPMEKTKALYYRLLDNATSRHNGAVIAVSEAVRLDLVEQGMPEERIPVIQNGIRIVASDDLSARRVREELGLEKGSFVVGAVGRLSPQKDYATLLKAAKEVLEVCPRAMFLIAGEGPIREELETMAGALGIGDRVRFLGYRADVRKLMSAFDVYVISSLWEGLPLAVLEAMAMRKPVVATAVPGTAEAVVDGETGILVPLGDSCALAAGVTALLEDPDRASRMGAKGRRRVEKRFSVRRMVDEHEALYRTLRAGGA